MLPAVSPVILLLNEPIPVASAVWFPAILGFAVVLQQTPRPVTAAPPSELILPPLMAVVEVIDVMPKEVSVGNVAVGEFGDGSFFLQEIKMTMKSVNITYLIGAGLM